ncbi:hypothetical protein [Cohnella caldifontis]|uniref:hypothetical protein n=1 Tax=Cohnella caldifontis TaxID=3027471 RepID=UPI0023ED4209|nr:hypothetical protein [Cohnella sp. YIM B05605]
MREAIRQRLIQSIPSVNGQVLDLSHEPEAAAKPYLLLIQGSDTQGYGWLGIRRKYEVWIYAGYDAGFGEVDLLAESVVQALDGCTLQEESTGTAFVCRYDRSVHGDRRNEVRAAVARGLRFSVWGLPKPGESTAHAGDSWLAALGDRSAAWLGSGWQVRLGTWSADLARPSVLWRIQNVETGAANSSFYELKKRVIGHFAADTPAEEAAAVCEVAERLQAERKIPLASEPGVYLTVENFQADLSVDGLTAGQAAVTLSRRMRRASETAPLMRQVSIYPEEIER